jgi:IS1 family transposase
VGKKKNKIWLIYAYHRESGEIVAYVWGKRDLKTAKKLRKRLRRLGISYDRERWMIGTALFQPSRKTSTIRGRNTPQG